MGTCNKMPGKILTIPGTYGESGERPSETPLKTGYSTELDGQAGQTFARK